MHNLGNHQERYHHNLIEVAAAKVRWHECDILYMLNLHGLENLEAGWHQEIVPKLCMLDSKAGWHQEAERNLSIVTTSSTKAELLALSLTAKDFIWWTRFFENTEFDLDEEPTIYCDNMQTIQLLTKETPKLQTALKHVDIH